MSNLTEAQKQRIEENRRKALEKRAAAAARNQQLSSLPAAAASSLNPSAPNCTTANIKHSLFCSDQGIPSRNSVNQNRSGTSDSVSPHTSTYVSKTVILPPSSSGINQCQKLKPISSKFHNLESPHSVKTADNSDFKTVKKNGGSSIHGKPCKATFVFLSHERFLVDVGYNNKVIEVFKTIPSRIYDANTKKWNFSIKDHDLLASKLKVLHPEVVFASLPKHLIDLFLQKAANKVDEEYDLSVLDPVLLNALLPFQKEGVKFAIRHSGRVLIADDMGLGKTIQAIAVANYYKKDWPVLVVTPSSVRYSWAEAFHTWLPTESSEMMVINSGKDYITKDNIILLSYDILTKKKDEILRRGFKCMIVDECHFLKNPKSARTKAAQQVMKSMNRIIMLSGTPALSRPMELFPQISALNPKVFPNFMDFGNRYCNGKKMPWGWDFSGYSNMEELQLLLEATVMIRRLKSDVIKQLPSKCRQIIILDPSLVSKRKTLCEFSKQMSRVNLKGMERRGVLLEYFHETGLVKIPAICEYIKDLLEAEKKFLVFAHHQTVMDGICKAVCDAKVDFIRIDGSTSSEQRKILCDRFQSSERCKVAVLSITAANSGITLTAAHLVIFAELFWNPGILTQAEDRVHRIGQEDSVIVQYLIAKGTADDEIWSLVQKKLDILNKAGLGKDNFSDSLTVSVESSVQPKIEDFWSELDSELLSASVLDQSGFSPSKRSKFS